MCKMVAEGHGHRGIVLPPLKGMGGVCEVSWELRGGLEGSRKSIFSPTGGILWSKALSVVQSFCVCQCVLKARVSGADVQQVVQKPHSGAVQAVPREVPSSDPVVPPSSPQVGETEGELPCQLGSQSLLPTPLSSTGNILVVLLLLLYFR